MSISTEEVLFHQRPTAMMSGPMTPSAASRRTWRATISSQRAPHEIVEGLDENRQNRVTEPSFDLGSVVRDHPEFAALGLTGRRVHHHRQVLTELADQQGRAHAPRVSWLKMMWPTTTSTTRAPTPSAVRRRVRRPRHRTPVSRPAGRVSVPPGGRPRRWRRRAPAR